MIIWVFLVEFPINNYSIYRKSHRQIPSFHAIRAIFQIIRFVRCCDVDATPVHLRGEFKSVVWKWKHHMPYDNSSTNKMKLQQRNSGNVLLLHFDETFWWVLKSVVKNVGIQLAFNHSLSPYSTAVWMLLRLRNSVGGNRCLTIFRA